MRAVIVAGAIALAVAALAVAAPASTAKLRVVSLSPFTVRGEQFNPRESVLVTLRSGRQWAERHARASSGGSFVVAFRAVIVRRCAGFAVHAVGSLGSVAVLQSPLRGCPPRPSIP
jgi:hypothetical protein